MTSEKLNERLLFFNPEITFDATIGGIKLLMVVDAFNNHINWSVQEGDRYTDFSEFEDARDYYLVAIGNSNEREKIC